MAKTIEIASNHKGKIGLCTRREEQRIVEFVDKGDVGVAMCDEDEAEILLTIGLPDYWKPTVDADDTEIINSFKLVAMIKAAETVEAVDALIVPGDERKNVVAAAEKRKAELAIK